jgi:hypothetical protein
MLVQDFEVKLIGPPVVVGRSASGFVYKWAFALGHDASPILG